jgi:hypothetical protein
LKYKAIIFGISFVTSRLYFIKFNFVKKSHYATEIYAE